ncbi:MAG TPA: hypothetical protein VK175_13070 [Leadbetterella sp.]|nr:hypothetical protein [Leadbetterella sp.]
MKNFYFVFISIFITFAASAQIETNPSGNNGLGNPFTGSINGTNNKPFWIGVGGFAHIYLDSGAFHKVGIGTEVRAPLFAKKHNFHAKLHVRHDGGLGNGNSGAGPHLLLDEATANSPAILRFRQSTTTSTGTGATLDETLVSGVRYWDIRGFANGGSVSNDNLRFVNSGNNEDVISLTGDGKLTLTSPTSSKLILKTGFVPASTTGIEFGVVGDLSNGGGITYSNNSRMDFRSGGITSLRLNSLGYVEIGSDPKVPAIKTWFEDVTLSGTLGTVTTLTMPAPQDEILSVNIMYNQNNNNVSELSNWVIDNTLLKIENTEPGAVGKTVRVFVMYRYVGIN